MTQLSIRGGQLYQGSQVIRPECGNAEHIACLRKYDKAREKAINGDIDITIEACVRYTVRWNCVCGRELYIEEDTLDAPLFETLEEVIERDMPQITKCPNCGLVYRAVTDTEDGGVTIYLKD